MIRIAICDDIQEYTLQLSQLIGQWSGAPGPVAAECFNNGSALLDAHGQNPFDIILLDIVMPGLSGIDTARELRRFDRNVKVVFLTSSPEFAIDSYSVKASNYLLKPVQPERLFDCLHELAGEIKESAKQLLIKGSGSYHRIPVTQVEYIEAQNKYVNFILTDGRTITSTDTFSHCRELLLSEPSFYKCHRSYVVNLFCVDSFTPRDLITHSGARIPIARSCQKDFESAYFSVMFEKAGDNG